MAWEHQQSSPRGPRFGWLMTKADATDRWMKLLFLVWAQA